MSNWWFHGIVTPAIEMLHINIISKSVTVQTKTVQCHSLLLFEVQNHRILMSQYMRRMGHTGDTFQLEVGPRCSRRDTLLLHVPGICDCHDGTGSVAFGGCRGRTLPDLLHSERCGRSHRRCRFWPSHER